MVRETKWTKRFYLGKVDGENIYIRPPEWNCGWYWGFGYLGNKNCHYHLDGVANESRKNMCDALTEHFKEAFIFTADLEENSYTDTLWTFCELAKTAYTLKEAAEVLGRGGSHYTNNPCQATIINQDEVERINGKVLPAIFDAMYDVLEKATALHQQRRPNQSLTAAAL